MQSSSPVRTPKLQLAAEQPSAGECWIPPEIDTRCPRSRKCPRKTIGGAKSPLESKPTPARGSWRAQTKPCSQRDPESTHTVRPAFECLSISCEARVSGGLPHGQGLWVQQMWVTYHVAQVCLEEVAITPTIEPPSRRPTNWKIIIPNKFSHC